MPSVFGFRSKAAERLAEMAGVPKELGRARTEPLRRPGVLTAVEHFLTPSGGIPGMTGLQMNSAVCQRYTCSSTGLLALSGTSEAVYNPVSAAIGGGKRIVAQRNTAGLLVATVEPCGAGSSSFTADSTEFTADSTELTADQT